MAFEFNTEDLNNIPEKTSGRLDPGEYKFTVSHAEERVSKANNTYASMTLDLDTVDGTRQMKYVNLHFTPKSMGILKKFVDTTGANPDSLKAGAQSLIGLSGTCVLAQNSESGYMEVKYWGHEFAGQKKGDDLKRQVQDVGF